MPNDSPEPNEFERAAANAHEQSLIEEFWGYLGASKKWWMLPILIVLLIMGVLIVLGSSGAAPFIYTLF